MDELYGKGGFPGLPYHGAEVAHLFGVAHETNFSSQRQRSGDISDRNYYVIDVEAEFLPVLIFYRNETVSYILYRAFEIYGNVIAIEEVP